MTPTDEQRAIQASQAKILLVSAFAGTGKTSTLVMYAEARPKTSMMYLAFNRSVKEEAQRKFPKNVRCMTTHGLAFTKYGRKYQAKLGNPKAYQLTKVLKLKQQKQAGWVLNIVMNYLRSASLVIEKIHAIEAQIDEAEQDRYIDLANKAWKMMCDVKNPNVTMPHDGYLKLFQLSNPTIDIDIILFDEAQDANPVTLAIVEQQLCGKVFVGDSRQSIYGFRGAVNAMEIIQADEHLHLTTSFRFGEGVARLANAVLGAYGAHDFLIHGRGKYATCFTVDRNRPHTVLSRTNAVLFAEAVNALREGIPFAFVGGVENYRFDMILDTYCLFADKRNLIEDKMIQSFKSFNELVAYGKALHDTEVNSMVKIVNDYQHDIPDLIGRICEEAVAAPTGNEVMMTTAHKSKGLEWMSVVLTDDFTSMKASKDEHGSLVPPDREEINLLYVAMTRALRDISVHPSLMHWLSESDKALFEEVDKSVVKIDPSIEPFFYQGTIKARLSDKKELERYGVKVGVYRKKTGCFEVRIPTAELEMLDELAARYTVNLEDDGSLGTEEADPSVYRWVKPEGDVPS